MSLDTKTGLSSTPQLQSTLRNRKEREDQYASQSSQELVELCVGFFTVIGPIVYAFIIFTASADVRWLTAMGVVLLAAHNMGCNVMLVRWKGADRGRLTVFRFVVNVSVTTLFVHVDRGNPNSSWWFYAALDCIGGSLDFRQPFVIVVNDILHVLTGVYWCSVSGRTWQQTSTIALSMTLLAVFFSGITIFLRSSRVQMHQSIDRKVLYLSHIAHELRTPLTGILGIASLLKEELLNDRTDNLLHAEHFGEMESSTSSGSDSGMIISPVQSAIGHMAKVPASASSSPSTPASVSPDLSSKSGTLNSSGHPMRFWTPGGTPSSETVQLVNTLSLCTESLLSIANAVLDISKIEAGALVPKRDHLNLRQVAEEIVALGKAAAKRLKKDKKVQIAFDLSEIDEPQPPSPLRAPSPLTTSSFQRALKGRSPCGRLRALLPCRRRREIVETEDTQLPSPVATQRRGLSVAKESKLDSPNYHVFGDGQRMRQILTNLMSNSVKFTDRGHVLLKISKRVHRPPLGQNDSRPRARFTFEVADTGCGVPEYARESIFEPFLQGPQQGTVQQGTGLGLYISRKLSEALGGTLKLTGNIPKGSVFCLDMMLEIDALTAAAVENKERVAALASGTPAVALPSNAYSDSAVSSAVASSVSSTIRISPRELRLPRSRRPALPSSGSEASDSQTDSRSVSPHDKDMLHQLRERDPILSDAAHAAAAPASSSSSSESEAHALQTMAVPVLADYVAEQKLVRRRRGASSRARTDPAPETKHDNNEESPEPTVPAHLRISTGSTKRRAARARSIVDRVRGSAGKLISGADGSPPASPGAGPEPTVLLVEDQMVNRAILVRMLKRIAVECDQAANGEEAVMMASKKRYETILMDCQMPILDGYSATQRIRSSPGPNQHTRIVALTASALPGDREKCLSCGMSDYCTKPVSFEQLRHLFRRDYSPSSASSPCSSPDVSRHSSPIIDTPRNVSPAVSPTTASLAPL